MKQALQPLLRFCYICILIFGTVYAMSAQTTILSIDFSTYGGGTTTGTNWYTDIGGCPVSRPAKFEVSGDHISAKETDCDATFYTEVIDISQYDNVSLQVDVKGDKDTEFPDYIEVFYILNGGAETDFATNGYMVGNFNWTYATQTGLDGCYLVIGVRVNCDEGNEEFQFRDILVTGTSSPSTACDLSISGTPSESCYGQSTGSIDITVDGGRTPYTYAWSDGQTTEDPTGLAPGTYTVTVTDYVSDTITGSYTVNEAVASLASSIADTTNLFCKDGTDGAIDMTITGGATPYTYLWSNGETTQDITGLTAGTYTLTVTDDNSCTLSASVTLTEPANGMTASINSYSNVNCGSSNSGAIDISVSGGATPYTYLWSNGATTQDISSLTAGTYTVTVTANDGCTQVLSQEILAPTNDVTPVVDSTSGVLCNTSTNGAIYISVTGGNSPYTYLWSNGSTSKNLSGASAGNYRVTVTDATSCTAAVSGTVSASSPLDIMYDKDNVYCPMDSSGSLALSIRNGEPPFTYAWSTGDTGSAISDLAVGDYSVTVTDANGCQFVDTTSITQFSAFSVLFSTTDASVGAANGEAQVFTFGGLPPYTYAWSSGATTDTAKGLLAGTYTVTVTDAANSVIVQDVYVEDESYVEAGSYIINMGVTPVTIANGLKPYGLIYDLINNFQVPVKWCINQNKDKDSVDFTYNGVDYKGGPFVIDGGFRTAAVDSVVNYWIGQGVVIDTTLAGVSLPVYDVINGFSTLVIDEQNENLVIPYFANAGIPTSVYTVGLPSDLDACDDVYALPHADPDWANHGYLRDYVMNGGYIWAGCHAVSVLEGLYNPSDSTQRMNFLTTNGLQCYGDGKCSDIIGEFHDKTAVSPYTYNNNYAGLPVMQFMGDMTPASENGSEEWYIPQTSGRWNPGAYPTITTSSGTAPAQGVKMVYGYAFDDTTNGMVMYEAGHTSDGKGDVENQVAFQRAFFNFHLMASINQRINADISVPNSYVTDSSQTLSVTASGGTAPYTYAWTTNVNGTFSNASASTTDFTLGDVPPQTKGQIICRVSDACGKVRIVSIPIAAVNEPPGNVNGGADVDQISCNGLTDASITAIGHGGSSPYTYLWNTTDTSATISNLAEGTYTVTITDINGCDSTMSVDIVEPDPLQDSISAPAEVCYGTSSATIDLTVTGGTAPYTYLWSTGATTQDLTNVGAGTYSVTVYGSASWCNIVDSVTIDELPEIIHSSGATMRSDNAAGDATATLTVSGGTPPYTYSWDTGDTTKDITGPTAGTHTVTVTDSKGCEVTESPVVPDTVCHCVSSGLWRDGHTWLGNCAGTNHVWPHTGDNITLSGYTVTVDSTHSVSSLTLTNNSDAPTALKINGDGSLNVVGNLNINTSITGNSVSFLIDDSSSFSTNGNLTINNTAFADSVLVGLNTLSGSNASLTVNGNLNLNNSTYNHKKLLVVLNQSSTMTVTGNISFDVDDDGTTAIITKGSSTFEFKGNFSRLSSPKLYGSFIAQDNSTLLLDGTTTQSIWGNSEIDGTDYAVYQNLKLNNTGSYPQFTLTGSPRIEGTLTLVAGNVMTNTDTVVVANNDANAIVGYNNNRYIVGNLQRYITGPLGTTYDFPVGTGGPTNFHMASITNNGLIGTTNLTTFFSPLRDGDDGELDIITDDLHITRMNTTGMWTIEPDVQPLLGTYKMTAHTDNFTGLIDNGFMVVKRPKGGNAYGWNKGNGHIPGVGHVGRLANDGYSYLSDLTHFSEFGVGDGGGGSLPITLLGFNAEYMPQEAHTRLTWSTAVEINNDYFEVERSIDGVNFEVVAKQDGAGNSNVQIDYEDFDENPELGLNYYRLKQVDFDGTVTYSDLVSVVVTKIKTSKVKIYPNPTRNFVHLIITTESPTVNIYLTNMAGTVIGVYEAENFDGTVSTELDLDHELPAGQYFIRVSTQTEEMIEKLMIID